MNEKTEAMLNRKGWVVECYSPLEIRHEETGSFATLIAAEIVIEYLNLEDMHES